MTINYVFGDWADDMLNSALQSWSEKQQEMWSLLTGSLTGYNGGGIWSIIENVFGVLQGIGYALITIFFFMGMIKTYSSYLEVKRPEQGVKILVRFVVAKALVTYADDLMSAIFDIVRGVIAEVAEAGNMRVSNLSVPDNVTEAISDAGLIEGLEIWVVALIGSLVITVLSWIILLTIYGRLFKLFCYYAVAPLALSTASGEPTQHIATAYIKSFAGVALEGLVIVIACIIYNGFVSTSDPTGDGMTLVWNYLLNVIFNMLVLVGTISAADQMVQRVVRT